MTRPTNIHLIEKHALYRPVPGANDEWTSGDWARLSDNTARALVGGRLHLHTHQDGPSYLGGTVLSYRRVDSGRLEIRFRFDPEAVGVVTKRLAKNWSCERLLD